MSKTTAHKIIIPLLLLLLVSQGLTGFFGDSLSREAFEIIHEGGGIGLLCLGAIHLTLNFGWIKAMYLK